MKKYISYLLTLVLLVPGLVSCTEQLQDLRSKKQKTHTVYFSSSVQSTKTGLEIDEENGMMNPNWKQTEPSDVHLFEMDADRNASYAFAESISSEDDYITAHFTASFGETVSIIVTPSNLVKSGGSGSSGFSYGAVVAKKEQVESSDEEEEENPRFYIPAVQNPDDETLKDPHADFLIGYSRKTYAEGDVNSEQQVVDLYFDRVAALGRLDISGFQGDESEKVKSVKIESSNGLVGSASYGNIDWGIKNTVQFERTEGSPITLVYADGGKAVPAEGAFEAYFVAIPGEATITSFVVETDKYKYTKTIENGTMNLSDEVFKIFSLDLSTVEPESISSKWYKADALADGIDYIIVSKGNMLNNGNEGLSGVSAPQAKSDAQGDYIEFTESPAATLIWTADAKVINTDEAQPHVAGNFTLNNYGQYLQRVNLGDHTYKMGAGVPPTPAKYYAWDYDGDYLKHLSSIPSSSEVYYYCYYDDSESSKSWVTGSSNANKVVIYTQNKARLPQTLSFDEAGPFSYVIKEPAVDFEEPTLTSANETLYGAITYVSSDNAIATVDAEGNVTFKEAGEVVITAIVAGDEEYRAASASYTINITSELVQTWYKVEEVKNNGVYMVVSNGNALKLNGSSIATVSDASFKGDFFTYNAEDNLKWTATGTNSSFTLKNGSSFIARSNSDITLKSTSSEAASFVYNSSKENITTNSGATSIGYLYYRTSNPAKWRFSGSEQKASLYSTTPPRQAQTLEYSATVVNYDANGGGSFTAPSLTKDIHTTVTYSSSNPNVASVDVEGNVVLGEVLGTTVITASAEGNESYKPAEASFILRVFDSRKKTRYVPTSSIVAGKNYLIISSSSALKNNSGSVTSESTSNLTKEGEAYVLSFNEDSNLAWFALAQTGFTENGHFSFSNGGYRLNRLSDNGKFSLTFVATSSAMDKYGVWDLQNYNGNTYLFHDSSTTMRCWVYYDGGWKITYLSNETDPSSTEKPVQLYVEDGVVDPSSQKQDRELAFTSTSVTCTVGETPKLPTLTGVSEEALADVTYKVTKDPDNIVAQIDGETGAVSLTNGATGTAEITASAPESDTYLAGSAQYSLTVEPAATQSSTYVLIPSSSGVISGATYLIVSADADNYNRADHKKAFAGDEDGTAVDVSASNGTITGNYSDYEFTITKSGSNYILYGPNGYVTGTSSGSSNDPRYILVSDSEVTMSLTTASELSAATSGDGKVSDAFYFYYTKSNSKEVLYYNADTKFKIGGTGRKYGVYLYMKYNGEEMEQNLSFSKTEVTYNMYGSPAFTAPTLSGAKTSVTYSSSNTGVARVNTSTGEIEFVGAGETNITATAGSGTINGINYASGSASYKLTVENEEVTVPYYTKVNDVSGLPDTRGSLEGNYIFVFEDGNKAYVFKAICNGTPSASTYIELTKDGSAIEVDLTANGIAATEDVQACKMQLSKHDTKEAWNIKAVTADCWIRINASSSSSARIQAMPGSGYSSTFTFSGEGNNLTLSRKENNSSNTAYLRFNTTQTYFDATTSSTAVSLYKLEENP